MAGDLSKLVCFLASSKGEETHASDIDDVSFRQCSEARFWPEAAMRPASSNV
jgi:hypothetical protein